MKHDAGTSSNSSVNGKGRRSPKGNGGNSRIGCQAGLTGVRLHDLRHTHASLLLKLIADPKTVSDRLGHVPIQITTDVYSHLLPAVQEAAVAELDAVLQPA